MSFVRVLKLRGSPKLGEEEELEGLILLVLKKVKRIPPSDRAKATPNFKITGLISLLSLTIPLLTVNAKFNHLLNLCTRNFTGFPLPHQPSKNPKSQKRVADGASKIPLLKSSIGPFY